MKKNEESSEEVEPIVSSSGDSTKVNLGSKFFSGYCKGCNKPIQGEIKNDIIKCNSCELDNRV